MDESIQSVEPNLSDGSTSDETELPLNEDLKNSAQYYRQAKTSDDRRNHSDSGVKKHLSFNKSNASNKSVEEIDNTEDIQPLAKTDKNKNRSSEGANKKASIFDDDDSEDNQALDKTYKKKEKSSEGSNKKASVFDDNDNAFLDSASMNVRQVKDLKRKSLRSAEIDDKTAQEGKKRRANKYSLRSSQKKNLPSDSDDTELEVNKGNKKSDKHTTETESSDTETDSENPIKNEAGESQRKARIVLSRQSAHIAKILKLINQGSEVQLKSLSRIGPKTAKMLHQYRKLHGKFTSIRDLEDMPGWTPKVFEQFVNANNIILD